MATPVETKVAAGSSTAIITGAITWILVTYVPAFHSGLPAPLATFLPWIIPSVLSSVAAYFAPHTATATDPAPAPAPPAAAAP